MKTQPPISRNMIALLSAIILVSLIILFIIFPNEMVVIIMIVWAVSSTAYFTYYDCKYPEEP